MKQMDERRDPQEDDPVLGPLIRKAGEEAAAQVANAGFSREDIGSCHALWSAQQAILRVKYGIRWSTPAELNPDVLFD